MINALKSILNIIGVEAGNIAGANITGYKRKEGFISTNGDETRSIGNDTYTRTDFSQGSLTPTESNSDLAVQGTGFFVLFDDTDKASFNPDKKISELNKANRFSAPITSGNFTVNGNVVSVNANTDTFNDVLDRIGTATGGAVTASYDQVQNAVILRNSTGGPINLGLSPTTNFLSVSNIDKSALQADSDGTFVLSNNPVGIPAKERQLYFTRAGNFFFDQDGFMVNQNGMYVASLDKNGNLIKTDKKTFDGKGSASDSFHFSANGILFNDTQRSKEGKQLALASFANPQGLTSSERGGGLFVHSQAAGKILIDHPDRNNMGLVKDQSLEQSNASTVDSMANMGVLQRFFPSTVAALKVSFSTQDDMNNMIK